MQLDKVTAEIRPRGRWESIDLGCALVRENYGKVMAAWFITVVPLWLVIIAIFQLWPYAEGRPWLAGIACLWVLPVCGRVPLFVLSRRLFGEDSHWSELLRVFPRMIFRRFFITLLVGPFNPNRCLSQPVSELEGLKGKDYRSRVTLLARNGGEGAVQAAMISVVLVLATMLSMLFVCLSMLSLFGDTIVIEDLWVKYVFETDATFIAIPYAWMIIGLLLTAVTLIEPFYVGAGFSMYVNSRTITEGWDIELAFKRMNTRVHDVLNHAGKSILLAMLSCVCWFGFSPNAVASNPRLDEVMAHEDFDIRTKVETVPVYKPSEPSSQPIDWSLLGVFTELIFWCVLAAIVVGVVWLIYSNRHVFSAVGKVKLPERAPKVTSVMGMNVAPESLPDDIVAMARKAWDEGEHQLALSLLYRGAISWMIHDGGVVIEESHTEQDCVNQVRAAEAGVQTSYFVTLTEHWVNLAYGDSLPEDRDVVWLCGSWPYGSKALTEGRSS